MTALMFRVIRRLAWTCHGGSGAWLVGSSIPHPQPSPTPETQSPETQNPSV